MDRTQLSAKNPIRRLEQSLSGGLAGGDLGVVMARAGVGKTAFLVQVGLDLLVREYHVLHIALGQSLEHVQAWYDALFADMAGGLDAADLAQLQLSLAGHRVIQTFAEREFTPAQLEQVVGMYLVNLNFKPDAVLLDGFGWTDASLVRTAAALGAFKACAHRLGAQLWLSAETPTIGPLQHPATIIAPCDTFEELVDVAIYLEPVDTEVCVRVLRDHARGYIPDCNVRIRCDTLSLASEGGAPPPERAAQRYTLLSGGPQGAEEQFGCCAETWGLQETTFSFAGHDPVRTRGLVQLQPEDLEQGRVSDAYLSAQMHRSYPDTAHIKQVLQTIWHQVNTAGEVFVVGTLQEDDTVRGGTGWAAELAKHLHKAAHVFDQDRGCWFTWHEGGWQEEAPPRITQHRFTGTGTRDLTDAGRAAIRALFERSFGPAPACIDRGPDA